METSPSISPSALSSPGQELRTPGVRKPDWLKVRAPGGPSYQAIREQLRDLKLFTVCEEARCPNMGECWSGGTATVMLLGDVCTRGCKFCAVKTGNPRGAVDDAEPEKVAGLIAQTDLDYVVLTSVDRDDLPDQGISHFARTVSEIKRLAPHILVETLTPDWRGQVQGVEALIRAGVDVYAHNVETVARLQRKVRDPRAGYEQSLSILESVRTISEVLGKKVFAKTSLMLGVGETEDEVRETMAECRRRGVAFLTLGQYLQPTPRHLKVERFVTPEEFLSWEKLGLEMGFLYVASGPLVRSSYKAGEYFISNLIQKERAHHGSHGV